jgi:hypothetical protein
VGNIPLWRYHTLPLQRTDALAPARQSRAYARRKPANQKLPRQRRRAVCDRTARETFVALCLSPKRCRPPCRPYQRRRKRAPTSGRRPFTNAIRLTAIVGIPGTRLELVRPEGRGILSPLRLPIPPPGRSGNVAACQVALNARPPALAPARRPDYGGGRRAPPDAPVRRCWRISSRRRRRSS